MDIEGWNAVTRPYKVAPPEKVYRPVGELKAFVKVHLAPRERQRVKLSIDLSHLAVFDSYRRAWVLEPGDYLIKVGSSNRDTRLERTM